MAKGRVVFYEDPPSRTQAPSRPVYTARARRRRRRRHRLRGLLFAVAALLLVSSVGYILWYTHPAHQNALSDPERDQVEASADGGESTDLTAAAAADPSDGRIVIAIDPGHGGVNPNIGAEDYGSEANGLHENDITLATARALYDLLEADGRFAPVLTADGSAYLKPSERGAVAQAAGAQLLLSIHLNYDGDPSSSGFECYAAPPRLSTNGDSLRFGQLVAGAFSNLGLRLRGANGVRYLYYDANDNKLIYESTDSTVRWDPTFTVLEACGCPAVLCEEGFISNAGDMALLSGDGCQTAAQTYYDCICSYFDLT